MSFQNPFFNIKVVELASVLAGPSVGQFLAELGAKVIKVENPATNGDVTRSWKLPVESSENTVSAYFASANWGKDSVVADITSKEGLETVIGLIKEADIVLASYKAGDAEKYGLDYESVKSINPKIIYGKITGYGNNSPRVGYDAIVQAESGFTYMNGEKEGNAVKMPVAIIDLMAAHQLKEGILTALFVREKTGFGDCVSVSLFDAGVSSLANQATNYLMQGHIPGRMGSDHPNIVPYGTIFTTSDNKQVVLAVGSDKQFEQLCKVLGAEEWLSDSNFVSNYERVKNREKVKNAIAGKVILFTRNDLLDKLEKNNVPAGAVNTLEDVFKTTQAQEMVLSGNNAKGIRNVAFESLNLKKNNIKEPPVYKKK